MKRPQIPKHKYWTILSDHKAIKLEITTKIIIYKIKIHTIGNKNGQNHNGN